MSEFLRDLVSRATPRGLSDSAEDVCAAAARAVRLVMRRFLSSLDAPEAPPTPPVMGAEAGDDRVVGGGEVQVALAAAAGLRREETPPSNAAKKAEEDQEGGGGVLRSTGSNGGGEGVFDLVWKAFEDLDQESACVEVRLGVSLFVCLSGLSLRV